MNCQESESFTWIFFYTEEVNGEDLPTFLEKWWSCRIFKFYSTKHIREILYGYFKKLIWNIFYIWTEKTNAKTDSCKCFITSLYLHFMLAAIIECPSKTNNTRRHMQCPRGAKGFFAGPRALQLPACRWRGIAHFLFSTAWLCLLYHYKIPIHSPQHLPGFNGVWNVQRSGQIRGRSSHSAQPQAMTKPQLTNPTSLSKVWPCIDWVQGPGVYGHSLTASRLREKCSKTWDRTFQF